MVPATYSILSTYCLRLQTCVLSPGAWQKSDACEPLVQKGHNLKHVFNTRVARIAANLGLHVQAWEDGLMNGTTPFPLEDMATEQVFVNAWDNVWEWGSAARAYTLANLGYKVPPGSDVITSISGQ